MTHRPEEGFSGRKPDKMVDPHKVEDEKSLWLDLKEKAASLGRRLMGVTESHLLPAEQKKMQKIQSEADLKLAELLVKANDEKKLEDSLEGVSVVDFRHNYFSSFVGRLKRVFPDDFELWNNVNLYFQRLDKYRGIVRFTDFAFLNELQALDSKKRNLLKYSFMTLANLDERYAEYFVAHAEDFGGENLIPRVYSLVLSYHDVHGKSGVIDEDGLGDYIRKNLSGSVYR